MGTTDYSNNETQTQYEEHLHSCMDAVSGGERPEAVVLDSIVGSFNLRPSIEDFAPIETVVQP